MNYQHLKTQGFVLENLVQSVLAVVFFPVFDERYCHHTTLQHFEVVIATAPSRMILEVVSLSFKTPQNTLIFSKCMVSEHVFLNLVSLRKIRPSLILRFGKWSVFWKLIPHAPNGIIIVAHFRLGYEAHHQYKMVGKF